MGKALVVGIDNYADVTLWLGRANDPLAISSVLDKYSDGSISFNVKQLTVAGTSDQIARGDLLQSIGDPSSVEVVAGLLYFTWHG